MTRSGVKWHEIFAFFASYFSENNNSITKHMKLKSDKLHGSNLRRSG